jgi:hypothetical protein
LPDINDILKSEEQDLLQSHPDSHADGQAIDVIIHREIAIAHHQGIEVNRMMEELRATRSQKAPTTEWKSA